MRKHGTISALAIGVSVILIIGCAHDPITAPTPTPTPTATPTPQPEGVRVEGVAVDAETDETIADAVVSVRVIHTGRGGVPPDQASSATTDQNGRFVLYTVLPNNATGLYLGVTKQGFDSGSVWWTRLPAVDLVLRVYRTLTIRPGESIEFQVLLDHYSCGFEGYPCRRVFVESPTGGDVDLEVAALDVPGTASLVPSHGEPFPFTSYISKMTAPPGQIWVIRGAPRPAPGSMRLKAKLHP